MKTTETEYRSAALNPLALIDRIIADIELTPSQHDDVKQSYQAVAEVLSNPNSLIRMRNPEIFPQGSIRLGTTVRPIGKDHFDLDMVCWISASDRLCTPDEVYQWVWDVLGTHETYRRMRQRKNRCIRLDYAASRKFHLDVTPAIPDELRTNGSLYVPDRELQIWCSSHPIGFADGWFKKAADQLPQIPVMLLNARRRFDIAASVEPLPEYGAFEKRPLQRIVQMLKRDRDEHFQNDEKHRPSSILLTTITTHSYLAALDVPVSSLLEFVVKVVAGLPNHIEISGPPGQRKFRVDNPVNLSENFADNWAMEHYRRFQQWHSKALVGLQQLMESKGLGVDVMLNRLSSSFGKERVVRAANALGVDTRALYEGGKLRVNGDRGQIGLVGTLIPKTINFGRDA